MMSEFYYTDGRRTTRQAQEIPVSDARRPCDTRLLRCFERPANPFYMATLARYM